MIPRWNSDPVYPGGPWTNRQQRLCAQPFISARDGRWESSYTLSSYSSVQWKQYKNTLKSQYVQMRTNDGQLVVKLIIHEQQAIHIPKITLTPNLRCQTIDIRFQIGNLGCWILSQLCHINAYLLKRNLQRYHLVRKFPVGFSITVRAIGSGVRQAKASVDWPWQDPVHESMLEQSRNKYSCAQMTNVIRIFSKSIYLSLYVLW